MSDSACAQLWRSWRGDLDPDRAGTHVDEALAAALAEDTQHLLIEVDIIRLGIVGQEAKVR